jgi:putative phosphoribosyl transferase
MSSEAWRSDSTRRPLDWEVSHFDSWAEGREAMPSQSEFRPQEREVEIVCGTVRLPGILALPDRAPGIVLFAHGSGSGRFSPRNRMVAGVLQEAGIATLLFDLLTEIEAADRRRVFDIDLLAERLLCATEWVRGRPETAGLPIGYFGASTGAAAALQAAAQQGAGIAAIVSRGGRPDLAMASLPKVQAPTLLIVGGADEPIIPLNREAYELLRAPKELVIIPGATHLFEEPGALEEVARLAREWFRHHFSRALRESTV